MKRPTKMRCKKCGNPLMAVFPDNESYGKAAGFLCTICDAEYTTDFQGNPQIMEPAKTPRPPKPKAKATAINLAGRALRNRRG